MRLCSAVHKVLEETYKSEKKSAARGSPAPDGCRHTLMSKTNLWKRKLLQNEEQEALQKPRVSHSILSESPNSSLQHSLPGEIQMLPAIYYLKLLKKKTPNENFPPARMVFPGQIIRSSTLMLSIAWGAPTRACFLLIYFHGIFKGNSFLPLD